MLNKRRKLYDNILVEPYNDGLKIVGRNIAIKRCLAKVGGHTVYFSPNIYVEIFDGCLSARGKNGRKIYFDEENCMICEVDYEQNEILFVGEDTERKC